MTKRSEISTLTNLITGELTAIGKILSSKQCYSHPATKEIVYHLQEITTYLGVLKEVEEECQEK
jgi:hypothetical protein